MDLMRCNIIIVRKKNKIVIDKHEQMFYSISKAERLFLEEKEIFIWKEMTS